jgi:hypothetical protein
MSSEEEIVQDEEENITNELDYEIPEADHTVYQDQEEDEVITESDKPLDVPIGLIRLGQKIKHATNKRGQTERKQSRRKKKSKAANRLNI